MDHGMFRDTTLSVIVPTCLRPDKLAISLQSLITSRLSIDEVLIGDDGGDMETRRVCEEYAKLLPLIHLLPTGTKSLSENLSRLVNNVSCEWILLLHDDDFLVGDHSACPGEFAEKCDFFFTDHWIANELGEIDIPRSDQNTSRYGRINLNDGIQDKPFEVAYNQNVCLDGFYVRARFAKNILFEPELGGVADFFWVFRLLMSGVRIYYSSKRTFAYRLSVSGITSAGLNQSCHLLGMKKLRQSYPRYSKELNAEVSTSSWFAVNWHLRRGERREAWRILRQNRFRYSHSNRHQFLIVFQLLWLISQLRLSRN